MRKNYNLKQFLYFYYDQNLRTERVYKSIRQENKCERVKEYKTQIYEDQKIISFQNGNPTYFSSQSFIL